MVWRRHIDQLCNAVSKVIPDDTSAVGDQPATQSDEEEVNFPPTSETPKAPDADSTPVHPEDLPAASVLTIPGTDREQRYSTRVRTAPQRLNL